MILEYACRGRLNEINKQSVSLKNNCLLTLAKCHDVTFPTLFARKSRAKIGSVAFVPLSCIPRWKI